MVKENKREIKFRAWDSDLKKMFIHFSVRSTDGLIITPNGAVFYDGSIILMQYTGLKDKNGKEIYENDIVTFAGIKEKFQIVWDEGGFILRLLWFNLFFEGIKGMSYYGEVIGNIYENPELLKERK